MFPTLIEVEAGLRAIMATLDPATLHGPDAVAALERVCAIEKMAAAGRMLLGRRVAETNAWQASGAATAEHFLAQVAGCSLAEAHRLLGTAKKLGRLPATEKKARSGELSAGQTGDIADAAAADPTAERDLLGLAAQASAGELREEARKRRHAATENDEQRHRRIGNARSLRTWTGDDGAAHLHWNHLPEAGAEVGAILDEYIDDQFHGARRAGRRERRDAYAADAFVEALRDAAAYRHGGSIHDNDDDELVDDDEVDDGRVATGGRSSGHADHGVGRDPERTPDRSATIDHRGHRTSTTPAATGAAARPGPSMTGPPDHDTSTDPPRRGDRSHQADAEPDRSRPHEPNRASGRPSRPGRRRPSKRRRGADAKVIVVIDHAALVRGHTQAGETCTIAGIGAVPVASVKALMNDAFLAAVITNGVDVHTVAHLGRQPNAYQQTALQAAGIECSTLGCPNRHRLERDHRIPYRASRHTKLDELDWSCEPCHDKKTYQGHMLAPGTGKRPLLTPEQQTQWNHDHPDNPVDPPQTSYPNKPSTSTTPPAPAAPPAAPPPRRRRPAPETLRLDL